MKARANAIVRANGQRIPLYAEHQPTFRSVFGRSWDRFTASLNGNDLHFWYDSTWGSWAHVAIEGRWFRAQMSLVECLGFREPITLED